MNQSRVKVPMSRLCSFYSIRSGASLLALLLAACSSEPPPEEPAKPATRVMYGPQASSKLTPFPSDRYTRADESSPTGRRVLVSPETTGDAVFAQYPSLTDQLNEQDGFSVIGGITVHLSGPIDTALLDRKIEDYVNESSPLMLIDVDPESPEQGRPRGLVLSYYPDDAAEVDGESVLIAQPSTPLRPRTRYLFVVTDELKDENGAAVGPSDEMAALLAGETAGEYEQSVRDAILPLTDHTFDLDRIVLATLFTTQSVHDETFAMAAALRASEMPSLDGEVVLDEVAGDVGDNRIAFRGRFTAPEWRSESDGRWRVDDAGVPIVQSEASLEFLMVFSDREFSGPRPVVVFGHGLTSNKEVTWDVASWLADQGVVAIGIDAPGHGSRATDPNVNMFDVAFEFFAVDIESKSFDLMRGRDNFRQMSSDQLQLVRALSGPLGELDLLPLDAPDGVPDLDPDNIAYFGNSFGSVLGPTALALAPELKGGLLNVGGGGLTTLVLTSPVFGVVLPSLFHGGTTKGDIARIFSAGQSLYDPGDPLNYAAFVTLEAPPGQTDWLPRSVLVQEAMNDALVSNQSTSLLSRTMGLTHVAPLLGEIDGVPLAPAPFSGNLATGATGAVFQFDTVDGAAATHGSVVISTEGKAQYGAFFAALFADEDAVVIDPFAR
jgi:pimeloyl-ACP methyl ester carboxylesterase